ncbi:ABC transporter permease [Chryseolinea sp. T2]|uniref:ABC transporter permease n=1 Tax=Chryseolinea sp. T2 TaxID=3129255 RepID=UPI003076B551
MIKNYLQVAFRNLQKNKLHTLINIFGLAAGMASVFLIALYIQHELSYDKFHNRPEDLYRVIWQSDNSQTRTPHPMAQALVADFPEVQSAVSITPLFAAGLTRETHSFKNPARDQRYDEANLLAVDTTFFDVFDFPIVRGDKSGLKKTGGVYMSESMAKKYFGDEDPLGKQLAIDSSNYLIDVVGVFKDVPENSHFHFDFLASYVREKSFNPTNRFYSWEDFGHYNYIRLKPGADAKALEAKLMPWMRKYIKGTEEQYAALVDRKYGFRLQPVTEIHLKSKLHWELEANGNIEYIYILGAAALFTLLIACVNFMNLSTAKSAERAKEIGVRKTMGAFRYQLAWQFLSESISSAFIAVVLSMLIIEVALPLFNNLVGVQININYPLYITAALATALTVGLVAGIYPSLYLSGVKPQAILKGKLIQAPQGARFRRMLVVLQFCISMVLISSALIIFRQLTYLQNTDLGFGKEEVIVIPLKNEDGMRAFDAFRNELKRIDGVSFVSAASNIPGMQFNQHSIALQQFPEAKVDAAPAFIDYEFFKTFGISLSSGRTFERDNIADQDAFVINETAAKQLGVAADAVGKEMIWWDNEREVKGTIIGVVKDFHFQSLHEPIRPLIFRESHSAFNYLVAKVSLANFNTRISDIQKTYREFEPTFGFEFSFLDVQLDNLYRGERRTASILAVFSVIALMIAAFGLFAMSMMLFYQKSKEVSIRKVLGASRGNLMVLLLGDFTKLVTVAIVLGTPLSWYIMHEWLKNFTYRQDIGFWPYLGSGIALLFVAWATLGYFTLKATRLNPADTLRSE